MPGSARTPALGSPLCPIAVTALRPPEGIHWRRCSGNQRQHKVPLRDTNCACSFFALPSSSSASSSSTIAGVIVFSSSRHHPSSNLPPHPCSMPNRSAQPISSCGPCQFEWPRRPDWPKRHAGRAPAHKQPRLTDASQPTISRGTR